MLPKDPHNALVRLTADKSQGPVGTGFICYQEPGGTLILTCRAVLDAVWRINVSERLWIDGQHEAAPVFRPPVEVRCDLVVLRCTALALRNRSVLPLGQPITVAQTRIISFRNLRFSSTRRSEESPKTFVYQLLDDSGNELVLRNDSDFPLGPLDVGSPIIDQDWVVGVVTAVAEQLAESGNLPQ
jgi:hypothetical protein